MTTVKTNHYQSRRWHRIAAGIAVLLLGMVLAVASLPRQATAQSGWQATAVQLKSGALLKATHIVFDPLRDWLYVAVPAGNGELSNSIAIYYRDGRVGPFVTLDSEPGVLAISADSQFLYVGLDATGEVVRVNLGTLTAEEPWSLGSNLTCERLVAADMVVLQNDPHGVVVARNNPCVSNEGGPTHAGVAVYDEGVVRPDTTDSAQSNNAIELTVDNSFLVGLDRDSAGPTLRELAVGVDGIVEIDAADGLLSPDAADIRTIDGRTYATSGDVVDPIGMANVGQFAVENNSLPVVRGGRAHFLQYNSDSAQYELHIFDAETMAFQASTPIAGLDDAQPENGVEFIDTGPDSMAIRLGDGDVFWLRVRLIQYTSFLPTIGRGAQATLGGERYGD